MWYTRRSYKDRQKRRDEFEKWKEKQAAAEALKEANALPEGVIHIPQENPSALTTNGLSEHQHYHLIFFPGALICFAIYNISLLTLFLPILYVVFGFKPPKNKEESFHRKGLLINPEKITFVDSNGNNTHFPRRRGMRLHCDPKRQTLRLSSDEAGSSPLTLKGFANIGAVATALEKWIDQSAEEENDPTEAQRQGHWLSIMSRVMIYRKQLPPDFIAKMPPYPYETEALQSFASQLKTHEATMLRHDWWVKLRTGLICLMGILIMLGLGISKPLKTGMDWAPLLGPALLQLKATHVQLKSYGENKAAKGFVRHFIATIILTVLVPYMALF